jgi:hypothetical protein
MIFPWGWVTWRLLSFRHVLITRRSNPRMLSAPYHRVSFCLMRRISNGGAMLPSYFAGVQSKSHGSGLIFKRETLDWRKRGVSRRVDTIPGRRDRDSGVATQ